MVRTDADLMTRADITDMEDPLLTVSDSEKQGRESGRCQESFGGGFPPTEEHSRVTLVFSRMSMVSLSSLTAPATPGLASSLMRRCEGGLLTTRLLVLETIAREVGARVGG